MLKSVLVISAALLLSQSSAVAQGAAKACVVDVKKNCAGVEPGEGRIADCIKKHVGDLSAPCQELLASTAAAAKTCTDDVKQRCADAGRRAAKIVCLKSALTSLSDGCKSAISQVAAGGK
jgi:Cysteine rich repeat